MSMQRSSSFSARFVRPLLVPGALFVGAALLLAAAFVLAGCEPRCRSGTALLTVLLDGAAANADDLLVKAQLSGAPVMTQPFPWPGGASGTLELRFPSGYPAGGHVEVQVLARKSGQIVGTGSAVATLPPGCATFDVRVAASVDDGGAVSDGGAGGGDPCAQPGSDGVVCAPTSDPCRRPGVCASGHCGPIGQVDDGSAVPGGQYLDRCCSGRAVRLNAADNCGGCGIQCRNGFQCINTGATDGRMWWCGCGTAADCWSNCCGTGNNPNTAAKVCAPSTCGATALCQGCPLGSTCEMTDPHYYCHY
jgi:hypothetical protein